MRAIKLKARVESDHTLRLELPEDVEEGTAEVIVLLEGRASTADTESRSGLAEFLSNSRVDPRYLRSKDEIDEDLLAERASWE